MDEEIGQDALGSSPFLLAFEQFCVIVPALVLISNVPFYLRTAFYERPRMRSSLILWLKVIVIGILNAVQMNIVFQWWETSPPARTLARAAATTSYVGMLSLGLLSLIDQFYFTDQEALLSVYLTISLLLDLSVFPTYFYPPKLGLANSPHLTFVILKLSLLVLAQAPKRPIIDSGSLPGSSIDNSRFGFIWGAPLWKWTRSYLIFGFRCQLDHERPSFTPDGTELEERHSSFMSQWEQVDKSSPFALLKACMYTVPEMCFATLMPRLLLAAFNLSQPFLIRDIFLVLSTPRVHVPDDTKKKLITATAILYLGIATTGCWFHHVKTSFMSTMREILYTAAYKKCLKLNAIEADSSAMSAILNGDINTVLAAISRFAEDWAWTLEVMFCLVYLASSSSVLVILSLAPTFIGIKMVLYVRRVGLTDRAQWRRHATHHVSFVSNILAQMKEIKMLGLGPALSTAMKQYQEFEIRASVPVRLAEGTDISAGAFIETSTPLIAVGIAMLVPGNFPAQNSGDFAVLVGLAFMMGDTLGTIIRGLTGRLKGLDSVQRVHNFLLRFENQDPRVCAPHRLLGTVDNPAATSSISARRRRNRAQVNNLTQFVIQFSGVSVTFEEGEPILQEVCFRIPRGQITMFFGGVGCGKSTIMKLIIGQLRPDCGSIVVASKSIAYCSQVPWIRNLSIYDNIVGDYPFDRRWLNLVIYVCALDIDLARLPDGERTLAGNGGCNLSGGQQQRVSLARALYAKEEIIIVDDILGTLDMNTSSAIRVRLFAETEILSANNMTLIMSTTMPEHTVDAGLVLEISNEGRVRERSEGSRAVSPSYVPSSMRPIQQTGAQQTVQPVPATEVEEGTEAEADEMPETSLTLPLPHVRLPNHQFDITDTPVRKFSDLSLYKFFYFGATGTFVFVLFICVNATAVLAEMIPGLFAHFWMLTDSTNRVYFLTCIGFCLASPVFNHFNKLFYFYLVYPRTSRALYNKVSEATHRSTFDRLMSTDMNFLLNKFTQDVFKTTEGLPLLILPLIWAIIGTAHHFMSFYWASSSLLLAICITACQLPVLIFYRRSSHRIGALHGAPLAKLSTLIADTSTGAEHIYAFGWQRQFLDHFYGTLHELAQWRLHSDALSVWSLAVAKIIVALAATGIIIFALDSERQISPIVMGFAFMHLNHFGGQIDILATCLAGSDAALDGAHVIRTFIQSTPQEEDPADCADIPVDWPQQGRIQLNCVTAQYRPLGGARHTALDHVSLTIEPGHIVGISGRTGSGKTSIFLAILNLLEFQGSISIDNREVRSLPRNILRSRITTITQSGLELKGTVRLNLNPFERPSEFFLTDDMQIGILRRVGLWNRIQTRGGLDAPFNHMKFSNGQKQLFHLARAMLHKQIMRTRIILIDEGARNAEIEDHMRQVMREAFAGCTILMVSHRPSLFREADRIITVDRGQTCLYEHDREQDRWSANRWNR